MKHSAFTSVVLASLLLAACDQSVINTLTDDGASSSSVEAFDESSSAAISSARSVAPTTQTSSSAATKSSSSSSRTVVSSAKSSSAPKTSSSSSKPLAAASASSSVSVVAKGAYLAYADGVIGNGQKSVLFFHASWCPSCKKANTFLESYYAGNDVPLTVYKVDYDSNKELRSRYGVTYQHTFVVIDGEGKAIKTVLGPTNAQLEVLLKS